jgi:hypothetical protein
MLSIGLKIALNSKSQTIFKLICLPIFGYSMIADKEIISGRLLLTKSC